MPRRWLGAGLAGLTLATVIAAFVSTGSVRPASADDIITRRVVCTTTRAHAFTANPNRLGGFVQNIGTLHVSIGRGSLMATLHVGAVYEITPGYRGGMDCQMETGNSAIEIFEESR